MKQTMYEQINVLQIEINDWLKKWLNAEMNEWIFAHPYI